MDMVENRSVFKTLPHRAAGLVAVSLVPSLFIGVLAYAAAQQRVWVGLIVFAVVAAGLMRLTVFPGASVVVEHGYLRYYKGKKLTGEYEIQKHKFIIVYSPASFLLFTIINKGFRVSRLFDGPDERPMDKLLDLTLLSPKQFTELAGLLDLS